MLKKYLKHCNRITRQKLCLIAKLIIINLKARIRYPSRNIVSPRRHEVTSLIQTAVRSPRHCIPENRRKIDKSWPLLSICVQCQENRFWPHRRRYLSSLPIRRHSAPIYVTSTTFNNERDPILEYPYDDAWPKWALKNGPRLTPDDGISNSYYSFSKETRVRNTGSGWVVRFITRPPNFCR